MACKLKDAGCRFVLSVIGEVFGEAPACFAAAKEELGDACVANWGFAPSRRDYARILRSADVSVSTSFHEFYGVGMLESVLHDCFPLVPKRLVYPELYPSQCLYNTEQQLYKRLADFCRRPARLRRRGVEVKEMMRMERFTWAQLRSQYEAALEAAPAPATTAMTPPPPPEASKAGASKAEASKAEASKAKPSSSSFSTVVAVTGAPDANIVSFAAGLVAGGVAAATLGYVLRK